MTSPNREISNYRVEGGCLTLLDPYVERVADQQLYEFAQSESRSLVCFVLAPRQMGKSSLMVRIADRLTTDGLHCVQINLHQLGEIDSESTLYYSLLVEIINQLDDSLKIGLYDDLSSYWDNNPNLAPTLRFKYFLAEKISPQIQHSRLIIWVDEIQNLISFQLQNSFLGLIRSLAQVESNSSVNNILFVLLGVAKPSDLLTGNTMAWNLGEFIELDGLDGDCEPLKAGLQKVSEDPTKILERILYWTGGQPFLTQVLCHLIANSGQFGTEDISQRIDKLVKSKVIDNWQRNLRLALHLPTIEDWFMNVEPSQKRQKRLALEIYIDLLRQGSVSFNRSSIPQWELLISGLVKKEDNQLTIRNPIYQQIFDRTWAESKLSQLQEDTETMNLLSTIYNRQVFILIDQSGSMVLDDGKSKNRWERLQEEIVGHLAAIFKERDKKTRESICESVIVSTFNKSKRKLNHRTITTVGELATTFQENEPFSGGNVCPILEGLIDRLWLDGKPEITKEDVDAERAKAALFIIYVDGQFDDAKDFEELIQKTALKINDDRIVKFIIIGIGDEFYNAELFDEFDIGYRPTGAKKSNGKKEYKPLFYLSTGVPANVVVFEELQEGLEERSDFIDLLKRKIDGNKLTPDNVREGFTPHLKDFFDEEG